MIIDHVGLAVRDLARSRTFYLEALAPLALSIVRDGDDVVVFGREDRGGLALHVSDQVPQPIHLAFTAATREDVRRFHAAALSAGARDNGAPGPRPQYGPTYYGAFVVDPDGHNIEAVTRVATD